MEKRHDTVFVGTVDSERNAQRVRFLEEFSRQMPLRVSSGAYRDTFAAARIVLNQSVRNDINFRVFEALATGS
ncbi:glycosyltransferase family 1 protein, partial [bacterium]|nr:glycosyltransferase family 1 protein [bacterium]